VQTAFEVAEQDGDCFDLLFVGEVLQTFFLNLVNRGALLALLFRFQVRVDCGKNESGMPDLSTVKVSRQ
jgi:hypothetical protein